MENETALFLKIPRLKIPRTKFLARMARLNRLSALLPAVAPSDPEDAAEAADAVAGPAVKLRSP